jgi:hypothetical protein
MKKRIPEPSLEGDLLWYMIIAFVLILGLLGCGEAVLVPTNPDSNITIYDNKFDDMHSGNWENYNPMEKYEYISTLEIVPAPVYFDIDSIPTSDTLPKFRLTEDSVIRALYDSGIKEYRLCIQYDSYVVVEDYFWPVRSEVLKKHSIEEGQIVSPYEAFFLLQKSESYRP